MVEYQPIYTYSYALVIGINDYAHGFMPLGEAESDAKRIAEVLSGAPYNFSVQTLIGQEASRRAILSQLAKLEETDIDARILFYFAGHGFVEQSRSGHPTGFIAAQDTDPTQRHTAIKLQEITDLSQYAKAKHISFIFDNCYSATALGLVAKLRSNLAADRYLTNPVYQALAAGETAVDDTRSMTEYILEYLENQEVDPQTGLLTMREMSDYVHNQMLMQTRSTQKPVLGYLPGSEGGEYVFLAETALHLPRSLEMTLRSEYTGARLGAVARDLIDIAKTDSDLASVAVEWLEHIRDNDPDEGVRRAAQSYFDELELKRQQEELERRQREMDAAREIFTPIPPQPQHSDEQEQLETPAEKKEHTPAPLQRWVWIGGIAAVVVIGVIIGLIALLGNGKAAPPAMEEPTPTKVSVAEEEISDPTATPANRPAPTPTTSPTAIPTSTPDSAQLALAETGVNTNGEWEPYIQEFDGVEMALVPAGCFMMGSQDGGIDQQPAHEVCFEKPFWVDVYEVTNEQYGSLGCSHSSSKPDQPIICVNWMEALAHCESRSTRLPTEAEWEYAVRGPDNLVYPWGNDFISNNVVYAENAPYSEPALVGSKKDGMSWVGAYDLSGNIREWVNDWYSSDYYASSPEINPQGPESGEDRVLRGGSWGNSDAGLLQSTFRFWLDPYYQDVSNGFRCARDYEY